MRIVVALALALGLGACDAARAHAFLEHADPRVGSSVDRAPERIALWFTQPLEPAFSWVKVYDAAGKQVDRGDKALDATDHAVMRVSVRPLPPGRYRVVWRVVSEDTHPMDGDFTFEVKP